MLLTWLPLGTNGGLLCLAVQDSWIRFVLFSGKTNYIVHYQFD